MTEQITPNALMLKLHNLSDKGFKFHSDTESKTWYINLKKNICNNQNAKKESTKFAKLSF